MNPKQWFESNNRYLAASLEWLRVKLEHFASEASRAPHLPAEDLNPLQRWLVKDAKQPNAAVAQAAKARDDAAHADAPPGLILLAQRFAV